MKPVLKKALLGLGGVVVVLVAVVGVAFAMLDPARLVAEHKDALLAEVSKTIGRQLTTGTITPRVGASLGATIQNVVLQGPARADGTPGPDQVTIQQVDVEISLLRALLTFGKSLQVTRFTVDGAVIRLVRDAEGRWDFQDILDKTASADGAEESSQHSYDGLRVASLLIRNARIDLNDAAVGRPLSVQALNIGTSDIVPGDKLDVWLQAQLVDGQKTSPIDLRVNLALLPKDLSFDPMPDLDVQAKLQDVDLGAWGTLLPSDSPGPVAGTLRTDLTVGLKENLAVVDVTGAVAARGLVLREAIGPLASKEDRAAARRGKALSLDVTTDVHLKGETIDIKKVTFKGSGVDVDATLLVAGSGLAGLKSAAAQARIDDVATLLDALPPSLRGLPEEATIKGPLVASLTKQDAALSASVDLTQAGVNYVSVGDDGARTTVFEKVRGKSLTLTVKGKDERKQLTIDDLALQLDTVKIGGKVTVPMDDDVPFVADVHSGAVSLTSLQGLVPPFKDAIGRGQKVNGNVQLDVVASAAGKKQQADAEVKLSGLDVNLASLIVRGDGGLSVKASPGDRDVAIVAKADLDKLSIQKIADGETSLNKQSGMPLRLDVDVKKGETDATINAVKLLIGKSGITGSGRVKDIGKKSEAMSLDFGAVDIAFNDLRQAVPGASKLPAGGRLRGKLKLEGALSAAGLGLDAKDVDMSFGTSSIKGTVSVKNFDAPKVDVDLPTVKLAFDDVRGLSASTGDLPKGGRFDGTVKVRGDTDRLSTMQIDAKINGLQMAKSDLKGALQIRNLDQPQFELTTQSDFLDVDAIQEAFGSDSDDSKASKGKTKDENPHGLSRETRAMLAGVNGKATLKARRAKVKDMGMSDFTGVLKMTRGVARFDTLEFTFYGGRVSATGTTLGLPDVRTAYDLRLQGKDIDFGAFLSDQTKLGRLFKGRVSPNVQISGRGLAPGDFALSANGPAEMTFRELVIGGLDLLGPINDAMKAKGGKAAGFNAAAAADDKGLTLLDFKALTRFVGGKMKLEKPIEAKTAMGPITISGGAGLDARLDFTSTLKLTPATIARMTGGKVRPKSDIPVPLKIGGTWDSPKVTGVDVASLVAAVVGDKAKEAVKDAVDKGKDAARDKARDVVKDATEDAIKGVFGGKKK